MEFSVEQTDAILRNGLYRSNRGLRYAAISNNGTKISRLSKESSFFGHRFKLEKLADLKPGDSERIMLAFMMMALLERRRG